MSKAALLNVNAEEFGLSEAAVQAPHRQSTSLEEWKHGTTAAGGAHGHPAGTTSFTDEGPSILDALRERSEQSSPVKRVVSHKETGVVPSDLLLAKAIDAMERRTRRSQQRARPLTRVFEATDSFRDENRVFDLAQRVSEIETRFVDRFASVDANPVGAVLARLEARLDSFTRQNSLAEAVALQHSLAQMPKPASQHDSFQRLEEKLDTILKAIETRTSEASPIALAASYNSRRRGDRRLGEAIDEISRRQQMLEFDGADLPPVGLSAALKTGRMAPRARHVTDQESASLATIRGEIAELVKKVDRLCHDVSDRTAATSQSATELSSLSADIAKMSRKMGDLACRHSLADAIGLVVGMADRLGDSRDLSIGDETRKDLASALHETQNFLVALEADHSTNHLAARLQALQERVDELAHQNISLPSIVDIRSKASDVDQCLTTAESRPPAVARIEHLIGSLSALVGDHEARGDADFTAVIEELRDIIANPPSQIAFARIVSSLDALEAKIGDAADRLAAPGSKSTHDTLPAQDEIEGLLRDLSRKMDAAQSPGADADTLNALQTQISLLATRLEGADDGLVKLNALQQSMQDVFAHLEQTRASVETSAAEAAREVLRIAAQEGHTQRDNGAATNLAQMQSIQDEAEQRTRSALSAVQDTLSKVVDRLSFMESEVAEVRDGTKTHILAKIAPAKAAPKLSDISLGSPEPLLDLGLEKKSPAKASEPLVAVRPLNAVEMTGGSNRADFIAAARRAAKTVQDSLSSHQALLKPAAPKSESNTRATPFASSRDYIVRHKKPALLGVAALLVIVGTITIAHRIGLGGNEIRRAAVAPPRTHVVASSRPVSPQPIEASGKGVASLALQPQTPGSMGPVAKSTPIAQATSAGLPMFATPAPALQRPPSIPTKLRSMAEAGDAGAQYILGMQYSEGRVVARDYKAAANWYQKAADKGVIPARYRLAALYEKGLGVGKDRAKARGLYLQAAEAGNPRAMHNLAVLLADGDGKPDYEGAVTWFRKAAQLGMEDSQYNLAILLARGLGVQQSLVQSYQWFAIAATQDDAEAARKRDEVGSKLGSADLAVARALAASFRPRVVSIAATQVQPPPGGWDGAPAPSALNSVGHKTSSL